LALLADEHPEIERTIKALIKAFDEKTAEGMQLEEIDKELEHTICTSQRKPTSNDLLIKIRALNNIHPPLIPIDFTELQTVIWGGQEAAFRFLRRIATVHIQELDADVLKKGFLVINTRNTLGIQGSRTLATITQQEIYNLPEIQRGLGAGSLSLEKLIDETYWIGVHKRFVALNMGTLIYKVQTEALNAAKARIAIEDPKDFIKLSAGTTKNIKVPIHACTLPVVHHHEWRKLRSNLASKAFTYYTVNGGGQTRRKFIVKNFRQNVKQALLMRAIYEGFGPAALLWNGITASRLYKTPFVQARTAPIPEFQWDTLNRRLSGLATLISAHDVNVAIDDMFGGEDPAGEALPTSFDYLEDTKTYRNIRNRVLEGWLGTSIGSDSDSEMEEAEETE